MHKAAKIGMLIWSILCFLGTCSGIINLANESNGHVSNAEAAGGAIGLFVWVLIWFFPMAGMGIVALVTRPKGTTMNPPMTTTPTANLCPHCGKYYAGQADFCPLCGQSQKVADHTGLVRS